MLLMPSPQGEFGMHARSRLNAKRLFEEPVRSGRDRTAVVLAAPGHKWRAEAHASIATRHRDILAWLMPFAAPSTSVP